jgi:putative glutamine amidotransferase
MSDPVVLVTATTARVKGQSCVSVAEAYTNALVDAGLIPLVLPPIEAAVAVAALAGVAGLVLTGGEDIDSRWFNESLHPAAGPTHVARDQYEIALSRAAHDKRIPTLALCRGAQIVNVALGGSLLQDIPSQRPSVRHPASSRPSERVHVVELEPDSRLCALVGEARITANSLHHQAIDRVGAGIRVVGWSPDGIVEGIESTDRDWWMVGVQWHPEELTKTREDWDRRLFAGFRAAICSS